MVSDEAIRLHQLEKSRNRKELCHFCDREFYDMYPRQKWTGSEYVYICSICSHQQRVAYKRKRRAKGKFPCPSKPLHPKCCMEFRPDKMRSVGDRHIHFSDGTRVSRSDKVVDRIRGKRQRRVNQYFIDEALGEMDVASISSQGNPIYVSGED